MDKKFILSILAVVVIVLAGVTIYRSNIFAPNSENIVVPPETKTQGADQNNTDNQKINKPVVAPVNFPEKATTLSYSDASRIYATKMMQFNEDCVSTPSQFSFRKGTIVMVRNASAKAKSIFFDGVSHSFKAYGFKLIILNTNAKLPHIVNISCGTGKNNATINLQ